MPVVWAASTEAASVSPTDPSAAWLGAYTETLFAEAFRKAATVTANVAAPLIGVDEKTLSAMTDELIVRAVRRGKRRAYTERDLRAYLVASDPPERQEREPWASGSRRKAGSGTTTSSSRVVAFTALPASKRAAKPKL